MFGNHYESSGIDRSVGILPYFQEEMMVQEDPIELIKMKAWSRRSKSRLSQISRLYSRLMLRPVDWTDIEKERLYRSRLITIISRLMEGLVDSSEGLIDSTNQSFWRKQFLNSKAVRVSFSGGVRKRLRFYSMKICF